MTKGPQENSKARKLASPDKKDGRETRKYTREEVGRHRTPNDAWMIHKGKVYDISNWGEHPGGNVIFTHAGDDFTDIFAAFHPASAIQQLSPFYIGEVDENVKSKHVAPNRLERDAQEKFEVAYRALRNKLIVNGYFKADYVYYLFKVLSNMAILLVSVLMATLTNSLIINLVGAVLLGLFWQQCGWLAHDFLHHQVFQYRPYGDMMGIFLGNLCQGFSTRWWKLKHNAHHAVPNLHESSPQAADGDPDIDTMPLLAWSKRMAESAKDSEFGRFMIQYQAVFYFPLLLFARLAWAHQSWLFVFEDSSSGADGEDTKKSKGGSWTVKSNLLSAGSQKRLQYPLLEKMGLILHYAGLGAIMYHMQPLNAILYFLVSQTSCGLMLALVFGLGHNGMSVYPADERPDFWKLQVSTTRNIKSTLFTDWFCGGLQYQVDHHLFPSLPRHNLGKVHAHVEAFCKEQGVTYHETSMFAGTIEVLSHLSEVSREFLEEFPAM